MDLRPDGSTVVPETDSTVIVAVQNRVERIDLNSDTREVLARIDDRNGSVRTNDGKCDPAGRLWLGRWLLPGHREPEHSTASTRPEYRPAHRTSPGPAGQNTSGPTAWYAAGQTREPASGTTTQNPPEPAVPNGILRTSAPLIPSVKLDSVTISNGIVWSADRRTMYYVDTPTRRVTLPLRRLHGGDRLRGDSGANPRRDRLSDGMTIDRCGNLWIALWGGYGVGCWNPHSGELPHRIFVPCPNAASCAFGGENLDTLYITTAGGTPDSRLRQGYPLSGSLLSANRAYMV
ncbi:MAG: SMP-30/gluconolactonase/LRE family protein [Alistipes indistinctus]